MTILVCQLFSDCHENNELEELYDQSHCHILVNDERSHNLYYNDDHDFSDLKCLQVWTCSDAGGGGGVCVEFDNIVFLDYVKNEINKSLSFPTLGCGVVSPDFFLKVTFSRNPE